MTLDALLCFSASVKHGTQVAVPLSSSLLKIIKGTAAWVLCCVKCLNVLGFNGIWAFGGIAIGKNLNFK